MDFSWEQWISDFSNYGWWEIPAVLGAIIYIVLAARKNRWCFFYGLISSAIFIYLTLQLKLYFDSFINAYYVIMSVYGWIDWSKADKDHEVPVVKIGWKKLMIYSLVFLALAALIGWWAEHYTDDALPYWDSLTTVFALLATFWVVKRYIENWIIWLVIDTISCVIYLYKGLPLTSLLFLTYAIMSIYGYINWQKNWKASRK